jgi:hypothetical protein
MLVFVAKCRSFAEGTDAWDYGWCVEDYRRSSRAAIQHDASRIVQLTPTGVRAYETAVHLLMQSPDILARWDPEEFWGVLASLVATLPETKDDEVLDTELRRRIELLKAPGSLVAFPLANIRWNREPLVLPDIVIGRPNETWLAAINAVAGDRPQIQRVRDLWWMTIPPDVGTVAAAVWVSSLSGRAVADAERRFDELIELTLLFEEDLDAREIWSGRGSLCRPGVRGLVADRKELSRASQALPANISRDLSASFFVKNALGASTPLHWFGEEPFPLDDLLNAHGRQETISGVMAGSSDVCHRLKVAARWHAKAHWSLAPEDAVLSIGIAFDALLGDDQGPQRRELAERFALLEANHAKREAAYRTFAGTFYTARSEVAHGQACSALERPHFPREMSKALRKKVAEVYRATSKWKVKTEAEYAAMFNAMKWGPQT